MSIKGVPTDAARPMADLIVAGENTVASRGLARQQVADLTLFAFAAGESVSEERTLQTPSTSAWRVRSR